MSQRARGRLKVTRSFEPGHLSPTWLATAYERVVPQRIRIVQRQAECEMPNGIRAPQKEVRAG